MPEKRKRGAVILVWLGVAAIFLGGVYLRGPHRAMGEDRASGAHRSGRIFDRVFSIILENTNYDSALRQPFLRELAATGALFTDFHAVTHPSYPNYLAMAAGTTFGIDHDHLQDLPAANLVDLFEPAGVSWTVYAENLPSPCFVGRASPDGLYVRRHEPYISFRSIQGNQARCNRIANAAQLPADLAKGVLPQYSLYVPNVRNDGHDTGVAYADGWLKTFLSPLRREPDFLRGTLIIVTFDENAGAWGNHIYTVFLGPMVRPGTTNGTRHDHYSLLRTIEDNYGVGTLGREDAKATAICCVWKK